MATANSSARAQDAVEGKEEKKEEATARAGPSARMTVKWGIWMGRLGGSAVVEIPRVLVSLNASDGGWEASARVWAFYLALDMMGLEELAGLAGF